MIFFPRPWLRISAVTRAPSTTGAPTQVSSSPAAYRTRSNVTVSPGSPARDGTRILLSGATLNCLPPVSMMARMFSLECERTWISRKRRDKKLPRQRPCCQVTRIGLTRVPAKGSGRRQPGSTGPLPRQVELERPHRRQRVEGEVVAVEQRVVPHLDLHVILVLELLEDVALLLEEVERYRGMGPDLDSLLLLGQPHPPRLTLDPPRDRRELEHARGPGAFLAQLGHAVVQAGTPPLARHLDETQLTDLEGLGLGTIAAEPGLELVQDLLPVGGELHVDEVADDDAPDVAQPEVPRDLPSGVEVRLEDRRLGVLLAGVATGVDVDRGQRFGGLDDDRATRLEPHVAQEGGLDLGLDPHRVEQRYAIGMELGPIEQLRGDLLEVLPDLVVEIALVDHQPIDLVAEDVADEPAGELGFLMKEGRRL